MKKTDVSSFDVLAHDLKSPLGNIKASAELLLQASPDPSDLERVLQRIVRQAEKGLHLIRTTLEQETVEKREGAVKVQSFPLRPFIESWILDHQETARKKTIQLILTKGNDLVLSANALYLSQILNNLVENAMKFSPEGGAIEISYEETVLSADDPQDKAIIFHVKDNGRGIPSDRIPFIFMQRVQAAAGDRKSGHGLDLAICKQLCEFHGGTIWVSSEMGRGSTFSFIIPKNEA